MEIRKVISQLHIIGPCDKVIILHYMIHIAHNFAVVPETILRIDILIDYPPSRTLPVISS